MDLLKSWNDSPNSSVCLQSSHIIKRNRASPASLRFHFHRTPLQKDRPTRSSYFCTFFPFKAKLRLFFNFIIIMRTKSECHNDVRELNAQGVRQEPRVCSQPIVFAQTWLCYQTAYWDLTNCLWYGLAQCSSLLFPNAASSPPCPEINPS